MRFASRSAVLCWSARAALAALLVATSHAAAPPASDVLYVICHPSVQVSEGDLRDVFLGDRQFAGDVRLTPVDNRAAQSVFLERVLKMTSAKYSTTWTKKSFRDGVNPPPVKGSNAETIEFVRHEVGACSYVTTAPGAGVRVVLDSTR
jgi:hypothetical protein